MIIWVVPSVDWLPGWILRVGDELDTLVLGMLSRQSLRLADIAGAVTGDRGDDVRPGGRQGTWAVDQHRDVGDLCSAVQDVQQPLVGPGTPDVRRYAPQAQRCSDRPRGADHRLRRLI